MQSVSSKTVSSPNEMKQNLKKFFIQGKELFDLTGENVNLGKNAEIARKMEQDVKCFIAMS